MGLSVTEKGRRARAILEDDVFMEVVDFTRESILT